jgi:hypothetical protein
VAIRAPHNALGNLGIQSLQRNALSHHYGDRTFLLSAYVVEFKHEHIGQAAVNPWMALQMPAHERAISATVSNGMCVDTRM